MARKGNGPDARAGHLAGSLQELRHPRRFRHEQLAAQGRGGEAAPQEAGLQQRVLDEGGLDPGGRDGAARAGLQEGIAPAVVGVGVGVRDAGEGPAGLLDLSQKLPPRFLVVSGVDKQDLAFPQLEQSYVHRAPDHMGASRDPFQRQARHGSASGESVWPGRITMAHPRCPHPGWRGGYSGGPPPPAPPWSSCPCGTPAAPGAAGVGTSPPR